jgi:hypothetical protein
MKRRFFLSAALSTAAMIGLGAARLDQPRLTIAQPNESTVEVRGDKAMALSFVCAYQDALWPGWRESTHVKRPTEADYRKYVETQFAAGEPVMLYAKGEVFQNAIAYAVQSHSVLGAL